MVCLSIQNWLHVEVGQKLSVKKVTKWGLMERVGSQKLSTPD